MATRRRIGVIVNTAGTPGLSSDVTMLCKGGPCSQKHERAAAELPGRVSRG